MSSDLMEHIATEIAPMLVNVGALLVAMLIVVIMIAAFTPDV